MRYFALLSTVWICAASGCTSTEPGTHTPTPTELVGLTFHTDTGSFTSFGWTGGDFHHIESSDEAQFDVKVTHCDDGDVCHFEGPVDVSGGVNRRRCLAQMNQTCTADADCPQSKGPCVYIYDAPLATPLPGATGTGACGWTYIPLAAPGQPATVRGTLNLTTNNLIFDDLPINLGLNSSSLGTFNGLCGECVNDTTPNDGKKDGMCKEAIHKAPGNNTEKVVAGTPCDVNRRGLKDPYNADYSMDCAPTLIPAGQPLSLGGKFSSDGKDFAITEQSPDCSDSTKCFCGVCSNTVPAMACMGDRDCPTGERCGNIPTSACAPYLGAMGSSTMFAVNQCTSPPLAATRMLTAGNKCEGPCMWSDSTGTGTCKTKPDSNNNRQDISCFPSGLDAKIATPGGSDHRGEIYYANTAGARCVPPGSSAALNSLLGFPGLLFQKRNFLITPTYAKAQQ